MPLISIITINYNNAPGLKKTIDSVASQTFKDIEYIVIDGGSTDGSADVTRNANGISYWVSEKDNGIYDAQNKGARQAKGKYCLFLNSGDHLAEKDTLEKVIKAGLNKDIVYGDLLIEEVNGKLSEGISPDKLDSYHFMVSTLWHPCTFIKRDLFEKYGYYKVNYKITADYEFFIRTILKNKVSYKHIDQFITVFNTGGIGSSDKHRELQEKEREQSWLDNFSKLKYNWFRSKTKWKRRFAK
jgi:glycosyltransferase involved in cell wall biosynthesis